MRSAVVLLIALVAISLCGKPPSGLTSVQNQAFSNCKFLDGNTKIYWTISGGNIVVGMETDATMAQGWMGLGLQSISVNAPQKMVKKFFFKCFFFFFFCLFD